MRFYLLDNIESLKLGEEAIGYKCISYSDEVLHDHFPDFPILPGTLITEGLAQLAGFLLEMTFNKDPETKVLRALLVQIDKMKFSTTSGPGDRLKYTAKIESIISESALVNVTADCDGQVRARGRIMFMMVHVPSEKLTQQRLDTYKVWTRKFEPCLTFR